MRNAGDCARRFFGITMMIVVLAVPGNSIRAEAPATLNDKMRLIVSVYAAPDKSPLQHVRVSLSKGGVFIREYLTDVRGNVVFDVGDPGWYIVGAHRIGYDDVSDSLFMDSSLISLTITMQSVRMEDVTVTANHAMQISTVDVSTGNQVFESETYHAPPTSLMTDIIQENLAGAARAPTGEVHIRGQHGEYTYYVDGVPVPLGVFGGLNDVVDPKVIDRATFITGGWPAEYGGQQSAVIDLQNRVPEGTFHLDASTYAGSYLVFNGAKPFSPGAQIPYGNSGTGPGDTLGGKLGPFRALNSNGQEISMSDHNGNFGYFVSGSRQETDRRIDNPMPVLYNDHGIDYFLYGKFEYLIGKNDYATMNLNFGKTNTEVPFDTAENGFSPDRQQTTNSFQTFSYYHSISSDPDKESNVFVGLYARQGGLIYMPSTISPVNFRFVGDSIDYVLAENRTFSTLGIRSTYDVRVSRELQFKGGFNFSGTTGTEDFTSRDSLGNAGPQVITNFAGSDFGAFAQTEYHPAEWTRFDLGVRYDQHIAPDAPLQGQVSPRIRWNFFLNEANTIYIYFGRLFMPTNIEGLRLIASNVTATGQPTLPERDDFWEASYLHSFAFGLKSKVAFYYKFGEPGIDDEILGASAVRTPVNIAFVHTAGIELALSYSHPVIPLTAYLNAALAHAYGSGLISGGFLPIYLNGAAFDFDHDQRLTIDAGVNYQPSDWFGNLTSIYGSGLTNGNPDHIAYQTGLFDFNQAAHVSPYITFNIGGGYIFHIAGAETFEPSIYVTNLFDNDYLLKAAYL